MKQIFHLEDLVQKKSSIIDAVVYYEHAVKLASKCAEAGAAHGATLIALQLFDLAETKLKRDNGIDDVNVVRPFVHNIEIPTDAGTKEHLIIYAKLRIKVDLSYISVYREDRSFASPEAA